MVHIKGKLSIDKLPQLRIFLEKKIIFFREIRSRQLIHEVLTTIMDG